MGGATGVEAGVGVVCVWATCECGDVGAAMVCVGVEGVAAPRSGDRLRLPLWGIWGGLGGGGKGPCDLRMPCLL